MQRQFDINTKKQWKISLVSIVMAVSLVIGLIPSLPLVQLFANQDATIIDATLDVWEDWDSAQVVRDENNNHVVRLGDDGGLGNIFHEEYEGPRTLVLSGSAKVDAADDEPAIIGLNVFDADYALVDKHELKIHSVGEYQSDELEIVLPEGVLQLQAYVYKNPGSSHAYIDDVRLTDLDETIELVGNGGFEEFTLNSDQETPLEPIEPTDPTDPTEPTNPDIYSGENIVLNSDFEAEFSNNEDGEAAEITSWPNDLDLDSGNIGQTFITAEGKDGSQAIVTGPGEGGRGQFIYGIPENTDFILSGSGRVSHVGEVGYLGVDFIDANGNKIGKRGVDFGALDWAELSITFTTVPGTVGLQVYTYKNPSPADLESYAYFDDISIVISPDNVVREEILINPSFEEGLEPWEDWGNFSIIQDPVDGEYSAQVLDEGGFAQYVQLDPGQTYELKFWGKVDPGHEVYWGVQEPGRIHFVTGVIINTEYEEFVVQFTAPDTLENPHVYVWNDPGGNAYFDHFSLKVAGPEVEAGDNPEFVNAYHREGVFFDDFDNGIDEEYWLIGKSQWGGADANNGVIPENVSVENGVVTITARGNNYEGDITGLKRTEEGMVPTDSGKRTGGALITKDHYASGSYEMRAKLIDELGVVNAMWTYFNNEVSNHEIDFPETPGVGADGRPNPNQVMANNWITETQHDSYVVDTPAVLGNEQGVLDGEWHTFRFDWHTDTSDPRVEYYLDDILVHTSRDFVPTAAGNLWIGAWFPANWAGVADFAEATMEIDWVKITPFYEDGDEWLRGWGLDVADLTEYPESTLAEYERFNTDNFIYTHLAEMDERLTFTDDNMRALLDEMTYFGINMQFLDLGMYDNNGLMPQSETDDALTRKWIAFAREYKPEHQIIATVNGNLDAHLRHSGEMRQAMADEAARLVQEYGFDGVQVDIEPFRANSNDLLVDYLEKLRDAVGPDVHISIATTVLEQYLPHDALVEIANIVDMINPMLYDTNGPGENEVDTEEEFVQIWKDTVLRYDAAIKDSNNTDVQLAPTMPAYDAKSYPASPGWPDPESGKFFYHLPEIENIKNAAEGLRQAIEAGAEVYGSGLFWWGTFTRVTYDQRDGQDYAKAREWWINEWVGYQLEEVQVELADVVLVSGAGQTSDGTSDLEFVTSADFGSFLNVTVDGIELASEDYTVASGSTIVVINSAYLASLDAGQHSLVISNAETDTHKAADIEVSFELALEEAPTVTTSEDLTTEETTEETTDDDTTVTSEDTDPQGSTTTQTDTDDENVPQTGEGILPFILLLSTVMLALTLLLLRKKIQSA